MTDTIKHFINLTDGIEWIPLLKGKEYSFIRVESTTLEKNNISRLFRDLDANFLMSLVLGYECHFYDCGTRRPISKTISKGLPIILKYLNLVWVEGNSFFSGKPTNEEILVNRKLRYFKRYYNGNEIKLIGHSFSTLRDGDKVFYRDLVLNKV